MPALYELSVRAQEHGLQGVTPSWVYFSTHSDGEEEGMNNMCHSFGSAMPILRLVVVFCSRLFPHASPDWSS
eukprot:2137034-Rhodomonas_salina.4